MQSIHSKQGSETTCLDHPGAWFALMCFGEDQSGHLCWTPHQHPPFLHSCCALQAQEQSAPLEQACHHSRTPPSHIYCPLHGMLPGHPALSASPDKAMIIYRGGSTLLCQKSSLSGPRAHVGSTGGLQMSLNVVLPSC